MKSCPTAKVAEERVGRCVVAPCDGRCATLAPTTPCGSSIHEDQYRALFEANPAPMWVFASDNLRFLAVNEAALRLYGFSREEFLGRTLRDLCSDEDTARIERTGHEATAPAPTVICCTHCSDSTRIIASIYCRAIVFGNVPAFMAVATDVTEQQRAEAKIRQSEANLALAQRVAHLGSWEVDVTNREERAQNPPRWSDETFRIFGLEPGEIEVTHDSFFRLIHPDERDAAKATFVQQLRFGTPYSADHRISRPDGSERIVHVVSDTVPDASGRAVRLGGTVQDITEKRRAEQALQDAEEKFRSIFENAVEGIFQSTPEGRFIAANPAAARILGFSSVSELMAEYDLERHCYVEPQRRKEFQRLINEQGVVNGFEYEVYRQDGGKVWISENSRAVRDANGAILYFEGTFEDVTERKEASQRIREQARLLDLAHDAIIVRDLDDRIEFWSNGAEKLYGWSAAEAAGQRVFDLIYDDKQPFAFAKDELLRAGEWRGELEQICKDGRRIIVASRWTLVCDESGMPQSILVIHTDVTEQKKLEGQFLRSQRLESIGTLAAGVAHDLNNILAPILLVAPLLRGELSSQDKADFLSLVQSSAERGARVVKQMLTFARGADGERVLVQPIYLLDEVAKIAEQTFPKTIAVQTRYPQDLWLVEGDPTQLQQVLLNLCVNARDAMPGGGTLRIASENFEVDEHYASMIPGAKTGAHVMIQVSDDGAGIPQQAIDKIFDPFFTTKDVGQGTGLGLSTVIGIVKSYGGFMNVYSEPGHTTFKVFLPAKGGSTLTAPPLEELSLPAGRGQTILVVDDEPTVREAAQTLLLRYGYNVMVAEDGIAALALFARHSAGIDLVVTDMVMPFMDGLTLIRTLRRINSETQIIVSTGREDGSRSPELDALAVDACLLKPYTREKFLITLDEVFRRERRAAA